MAVIGVGFWHAAAWIHQLDGLKGISSALSPSGAALRSGDLIGRGPESHRWAGRQTQHHTQHLFFHITSSRRSTASLLANARVCLCLYHTQSKWSPFWKKLIHTTRCCPYFDGAEFHRSYRVAPVFISFSFVLCEQPTLKAACQSSVALCSSNTLARLLFILLILSPGTFLFHFFFFFFSITFLSCLPFNSTLYLHNQKRLVMLARLDWKKKRKSSNLSFKMRFPLLQAGNLSRLTDMHLFQIS